MVVKSFRGLLADGAQEQISLATIKGKVGYRIIKFQLMTEKPGTTDYEQIVKIFKTEQTTIVEDINFTDSDLLAAGYTEGGAATNFIGNPMIVIFDQEIFNQDIFISHFDAKGALPCNYYLELEQFPLASDEATVATLKDIKLNA
jgi:hypothetical protein